MVEENGVDLAWFDRGPSNGGNGGSSSDSEGSKTKKEERGLTQEEIDALLQAKKGGDLDGLKDVGTKKEEPLKGGQSLARVVGSGRRRPSAYSVYSSGKGSRIEWRDSNYKSGSGMGVRVLGKPKIELPSMEEILRAPEIKDYVIAAFDLDGYPGEGRNSLFNRLMGIAREGGHEGLLINRYHLLVSGFDHGDKKVKGAYIAYPSNLRINQEQRYFEVDALFETGEKSEDEVVRELPSNLRILSYMHRRDLEGRSVKGREKDVGPSLFVQKNLVTRVEEAIGSAGWGVVRRYDLGQVYKKAD